MNTGDSDEEIVGSTAPPDEQNPANGRERLGMRPPRAKRPPDSARCAGCDGNSLSTVRSFSAGSGVGAHPFAEDVICHDCGLIGPPTLLPK